MNGQKRFVIAGGTLITCTALITGTMLILPDLPSGGHDVAVVTRHRHARPDIVWILTDDQRRGLLDAMPAVRHLLAASGTRFTNTVVPTSLCAPSRASLLTGRYAHDTGVWHNDSPAERRDTGVVGGYRAFIRDGNDKRTVGRALNLVGYHTAFVGKYLNGYRNSYATPPGWDRFVALGPGVTSHYDFVLGGRRYGEKPRDYATDVIGRRAARLIRGAPQKSPLFMVVAPNSPHAPYAAAPRDSGTAVRSFVHRRDFGAFNERDVSDKPFWVKRLTPVPRTAMRQVARRQHRMVMSVDNLVSRVQRALEDRGSLHRTMLIFMSDNGLTWGEHRLRGKNVPYDAATRVPLVLRWDGHVPAGAASSRLVSSLDVTATIADAANASMPWVRGVSLLKPTLRAGALLEGSTGEPMPVTGSGVHHPAYCGWRTERRLFVRYSSGQEELYLLAHDPLEKDNVAGARRYVEILRRMRGKANSQCRPRPPNFSWTR